MKTVAYLGIPGSYSYLAARAYFGGFESHLRKSGGRQYSVESVEFKGVSHFRDIFRDVAAESVHYGIIPVENSLAGSVYDNYDLLHEHDVSVVGEYYLKIDLNLLGTKSSMQPKTRLEHMHKVVSHYKALEQCETFLDSHPWMHPEILSDTAGAAKYVANQNDPFLAAIASAETAKIYNLEILAANIQDNPFNFTRFLIIAKQPEEREGANKCSVIFTVNHSPGSLFAALKILAEGNMNLDKIESRPISGRPFEYVFYVDFDWTHTSTDEVSALLKEFKKNTNELKILGFYRAGAIPNAK